MISLVEQITAILPQTQCRQCGYEGCLPYAQALSQSEAEINLCTPGGEIVISELAYLLHQPIQAPKDATKAYASKAIAIINEQECIGCTACIKVCPVDAIMGSTKHMHTVLVDECTGCELCLPSCPVDCIDMQAVTDKWLPRAHTLVDSSIVDTRLIAAKQAQQRYQHRQERLQRLKVTKDAQRNQKTAPVNQSTTDISSSSTQFNTKDLIAKAMARAKSQQSQRQTPDNHNIFLQQQIEKAQQQAAYRHAEHNLRYGTLEEQEAALAWLRQYKKDVKNKV